GRADRECHSRRQARRDRAPAAEGILRAGGEAGALSAVVAHSTPAVTAYRKGSEGDLTYRAICSQVANHTPDLDFMYATKSSRCWIGARCPLRYGCSVRMNVVPSLYAPSNSSRYSW